MSSWMRLHRPDDARHDRLDLGHRADHLGPRRDARPFEVVVDLRPHQFRLLGHLVGERPASGPRLVGDDAERRLQRMGKVADLGARPLDDLLI